MAPLVKIANGILVKMANVITTYIPTYPPTNLLQHTYLLTYLPTHPLAYLPTHPPIHLLITTYLPLQHTYLSI
jgi:hypothetical protein